MGEVIGIPTRLTFGVGDREEVREDTRAYYALFLGVLKAAGDLCTQNRSGSYGPPSTNFLNSDEGYLQVLWLKVSRLINMVEVKRETLAENGWSAWANFDRGIFADSLIDLVNYAAFWATDIALAGQWPEGLQAQPKPCEPSQEFEDDEEVGVETIQCPRCQSARHGFFGRVDGAWVIGCRSCGISRTSQQAGSHFAWYAETRGSRSFSRSKYGVQGDLTHQVKTPEIKTVPRPPTVDPELELAVETLAEKMVRAQALVEEIQEQQAVELLATVEEKEAAAQAIEEKYPPPSPPERQVEIDGRKPKNMEPIVTTQSTRSIPKTLLQRELRSKPPGGAHRNPVGDLEEEDEGVRPDRQPSPSETTPLQTLSCFCGAEGNVFLVNVDTKTAKLKRFRGKKTALRFLCNCEADLMAVDMRELTRVIEGRRVKAKVLPPVDLGVDAPAQE